MTLTLVAIVNGILALGVLVVIVGMHVRAIRTSHAEHGGQLDANRLGFTRSAPVEFEVGIVEDEVEVVEDTHAAGLALTV